MSIAKRIKSKRIQLGLTSQYIAQSLNVSNSTYFDWENGRQIRGEEHYEGLSIILHMSLAELITGKIMQEELEMHVKDLEEKLAKIRSLI